MRNSVLRLFARPIALLALSSLFMLPVTSSVLAQDSDDDNGLQTARGVNGDSDDNGRTPVVSFQVVRRAATNGYAIIVDARVPQGEYQSNPIVVDYFINRQYFTSQYRSDSLPGSLGIDIGSDIATPPFNFSLVVKTIAPNGRHFPTVVEGAVFSDNLLSTFDQCTLTRDNVDYSAGLVSTSQLGNDSVELSFNGESSDGARAEATAVITISGTAANSTLDFIVDGVARTVSAEGNVTRDDDEELIALALSTSDGTTTLRCS